MFKPPNDLNFQYISLLGLKLWNIILFEILLPKGKDFYRPRIGHFSCFEANRNPSPLVAKFHTKKYFKTFYRKDCFHWKSHYIQQYINFGRRGRPLNMNWFSVLLHFLINFDLINGILDLNYKILNFWHLSICSWDTLEHFINLNIKFRLL